jgi:hypothetical protein
MIIEVFCVYLTYFKVLKHLKDPLYWIPIFIDIQGIGFISVYCYSLKM